MDILQLIQQFLATLDVDKIAWFIFLLVIYFRTREFQIEDLTRLIIAWRASIIQSPSLEDDKLLPTLNAVEAALTTIISLFPQEPAPAASFELDDGSEAA